VGCNQVGSVVFSELMDNINGLHISIDEGRHRLSITSCDCPSR
jgi:hypothetical protein